ncbi:hypothetical protein NDU88_005063 [Pleurodeles waltl]|uniref:Uncharacterized protein n=1 Tax=Pleurodeles waltl TaxID=8319 RepID=A0AAV7WW25_PLEWA|nr:hypothetical protein NDU88_005063 [Pleurodeles waltl]
MLASSCGALRCLPSRLRSLQEPPESRRAPAAVRAAGARHPWHPQLSRVNGSRVQSGDGLERNSGTDQSPIPALQEHPTNQSCTMADASQGATMDRILQEILAVGRRLEGMDSMMTFLTEDTKSMRLDIAGFQSRVTTLEQRVTTVETQAVLASDRD